MWDAACARAAEALARLVPGDNRPLVPRDLICISAFALESRNSREAPMQLQTLQKTQLAYKLGLLLGRLLEQHMVRPCGWPRENYCVMVELTAQGTTGVIRCAGDSDHSTVAPVQKSAQLVVVQQITSSGLLPKLATALSKLADMVQATEQTSPSCKDAALALLELAVNLIDIWPGTGGVLTSAAASAIFVPAVQLADAMVQHIITAPQLRIVDSELALEAACRLVMYIGSMSMDVRHRRTRLAQAPQGLSVVMAGLASPACQQLVLTVVAVAADPNIIPAVFGHTHEAAVAAAADVQQNSAGAASGAVQRVPAADKASKTVTADSMAQKGSTSSGSGNSDGVAAQHVELCQQQRLLLLQLLYPALSSSSRWADFASVSAVTLSRVRLTFNDFKCVIEAAVVCFSFVNKMPLNLGASAANSSSTSRQRTSRTEAPAMLPSSLNVLPQLPVLLLQWAYLAASTPGAYPDRSVVYETAGSLSSVALDCWQGGLHYFGSQVRLNRSQVTGQPPVSGNSDNRDQLPAARITELLLQNLRLLQRQALAMRAAAATRSGTVGPGGNAAAAAAPEVPPTETSCDPMDGISSIRQLSQLMCWLKPSLGPAVWQQAAQELYPMLEWWLRVGSSSHEEQQQQQAQCSEARSNSSSSSARVAVEWNDDSRFMQLCANGQLSGAICTYYQLNMICEAWLNPTAVIHQAEAARVVSYESVLVSCAAAAAPGSFERQQLLTLLISLIKKSSSTDGLLTLPAAGLAQTVTSGCELGCITAAVQHMLSLCEPCGSSGSTGAPCSSSAAQDSSSDQDTCRATDGTTSRGGISSSNGGNASTDGCSSNESSADECRAANATAAAPWLVVAARALINRAERLIGCLEYQQESPDVHRVLRNMHKQLLREIEADVLRNSDLATAVAVYALLAEAKHAISEESSELADYIYPILHWSHCVRHIICALETALLGLTGQQGAKSGSTNLVGPTKIGSAVAADIGSCSDSTVHPAAAPAAAFEVLSQTPATTVVTVSYVQHVQFGSVVQQLQCYLPKLQQLTKICSLLAPVSYVFRDWAPAQWLQNK